LIETGTFPKGGKVGYYYICPETKKYQLFQTYISSKLVTKHSRIAKANELIDKINSQLLQGYNPFKNDTVEYNSVFNAINKIIESKTTYTRRRTISTYKSFVNTFLIWLKNKNLSHIKVERFDVQNAISFSDYLKIEKKVCNRTHNNYIMGLRTIFNELVDRMFILNNPFKKVKFLPEEQRNIFAYNPLEIKKLKDFCLLNDERMWLVCQLIFYCAIRPAELVQLKIQYIDAANGKINIPSNISKNKKQSIISVPLGFLEDLRKLNLEELDQESYLFSKHLMPGKILIAPTRLAERFKKIANIIGISRRLYDLKHTGAGLAIQNGANIKDLQLHLRHSDIKITDEYLKAFSSEVSQTFIDNYPVI
jgi:integrase